MLMLPHNLQKTLNQKNTNDGIDKINITVTPIAIIKLYLGKYIKNEFSIEE